MSTARDLPSLSVAPWAEIVPNMPPITVDELHAIPEDRWTYELIEGVLIRMPLSSGGASNIGARLLVQLGSFVEDNGLVLHSSE